MSTVHDVLDIVGLIPGFDAADLINAGIYLIEGDRINAALSMAAVIPVIGGAATAGKVVGKTNRLTKSKILNWLDEVETMDPQKLRSDLLSVGFEKQPGPKQHYKHGNVIVRLDEPHFNTKHPTPYHHMHINIDNRYNTLDKYLNPVKSKSYDAHIKIQPW